MQLELSPTRTSVRPVRGWSQAVASQQLCRPHLRVLDPQPEALLETSAVLVVGATPVGGGMVAVDGFLDPAAAGTALDIDGNPIRVRGSGDFTAAIELKSRDALVITVTIPLGATAPAVGGSDAGDLI
jgi:hypothetical protein